MDPLGRLQGVVALAAPPEPPPGEGPEWGKAAPIGLLVILLLCAAMWLLFRNMSKHLRKVREAAAAEEAGSAAPAGQAGRSGQADRAADADVGTADDDDDRVATSDHTAVSISKGDKGDDAQLDTADPDVDRPS